MQIDLEPSLDRWTQAALLNPEQASRILEFEAAQTPRRGSRFPALVGLAFGGVMLAAGILLFVAAHWSDLSPTQRMTLLVATVAGLHLAAAFCAERYHAMAVTLHAVGTAALGGAIFLGGQIFNLQEHWPTGILLWAIGALAGWWLLRQWPQMAIVALLVPCWLIGEWTEAVTGDISRPVAAAFAALLAICYLSVRTAETERRDPSIARTFAWIGGLAVFPSVLVAAASGWFGATSASVPGPLGIAAGWTGAFLLPLGFAGIFRRNGVWMNAVAALWVAVLSALSFQNTYQGISAAVYAWCGVGAIGMIAWGVHESRPERINLGMAGFALTVLFFYFSNVMDMLDRSTSLIVLGVFFLAGAWYWEKLRRRLVARAQAGGIQ